MTHHQTGALLHVQLPHAPSARALPPLRAQRCRRLRRDSVRVPAAQSLTRPFAASCRHFRMLAKLFDLEDYAGTYRETRNAYLKAANQLKLATGPYKAARDAYVAATATYTKSLYE